MEELFKKMKSQKGASGIDVIMSAAMIVITMTVVTMLYVNISLQSRNVTRTAGATRMATNIAENIRQISYEEFINAYDGIPDTETINLKTYRRFDGSASNRTIYDTKIPTGYTLYINADKEFGSHTAPEEQFDLVRSVDIIIRYKVGKNENEVNFSTVKQRELIGECNAPVITNLRTIDKEIKDPYIYPIKYDATIGSYIKTIEEDMDWYNYSEKKWATVVVSTKTEAELFDPNGKLRSSITDNTFKYIWIPAFYTKADGTFAAFAYNASDKIIVKGELESEDGSGKTFSYYTFGLNEAGYEKEYNGTATGKWIELKEENLTNVQEARILNASQYGPFIIH